MKAARRKGGGAGGTGRLAMPCGSVPVFFGVKLHVWHASMAG